MGGVIVHDKIHIEIRRDVAFDLVQEAQKLTSAVTGVATSDDGAVGGGLNVPSNITLIPMPAKCPESGDQIVDHRCDTWNKLIDQPWRIMSIGMRNWLYRF